MVLTVFTLLGLWSIQDDELMRVTVYPGSWAAALSKIDLRPVDKRDIRSVGCVGLEAKEMFCDWERRVKGRWRKFDGRADLSAGVPVIKGAKPAVSNGN